MNALGPHLPQDLLRGNAAVHHPDTVGLAVQRLDAIQERLQCRAVRGVAGHDLVGQRQSIRRDHQRDHHLAAVRPAVAAVAVPGLGDPFAHAFEIRAGQVVQENVELRVEQRPPLLDQVTIHKLKLPPQRQAQPAVSERPRPAKCQLLHPQAQRVHGVRRNLAVLRGGREVHVEQLIERGLQEPRVLVEDLQRPAPGRFLRVVDLAEVEHLPLNHSVPGQPTRLHDAVVAVPLAVLEALLAAEEHRTWL